MLKEQFRSHRTRFDCILNTHIGVVISLLLVINLIFNQLDAHGRTDDASNEALPVMLNLQPVIPENIPAEEQNSITTTPGNKTFLGQAPASRIRAGSRPDYIENNQLKELSPEANELASLLDLHFKLEELKRFQNIRTSNSDIDLKVLLVRQDLTEEVLGTIFDIGSALNTIDKQMARDQELRAIIMDKRDKAIRYNTYADLVAGGITGVLSGSFRLGNISELASGTVDVFEGAAEMGLAGWALKNEKVEHRLIQGIPNVLAEIVFPENSGQIFPKTVWTYLNTVPANSRTGQTRREIMANTWIEKKFCLIHRGHKLHHKERMKHVTGTIANPRLTIDVLEDRIAMMQDLRTQITLMREPLAEIARYARARTQNRKD